MQIPGISTITLGVADLDKATAFYTADTSQILTVTAGK